MQRKKRIPKTLGYVTVLSIIMLFLFVGYNGPKNLSAEEMPFQHLYDYSKWKKEDLQPLTLPDKLPDGGNLVIIKFISSNGGIFVLNANGDRPPICGRIKETGSVEDNDCKSLTKGSAVLGLGHKTTLYTIGSPNCVAETFGGYVMEYDPETGKSPCPRN